MTISASEGTPSPATPAKPICAGCSGPMEESMQRGVFFCSNDGTCPLFAKEQSPATPATPQTFTCGGTGQITPEAQAELDAFAQHLATHQAGHPACRFCVERAAKLPPVVQEQPPAHLPDDAPSPWCECGHPKHAHLGGSKTQRCLWLYRGGLAKEHCNCMSFRPIVPSTATATDDCGHFCQTVYPYGFVAEADCPVHDVAPPATPAPSLEPFVYVLNRLEAAAQADKPFEAGYPAAREAVLMHVRTLAAELESTRSALREAQAKAQIHRGVINTLWDEMGPTRQLAFVREHGIGENAHRSIDAMLEAAAAAIAAAAGSTTPMTDELSEAELASVCASCGHPYREHGKPHEWDAMGWPSCPPPSLTGTFRSARAAPPTEQADGN